MSVKSLRCGWAQENALNIKGLPLCACPLAGVLRGAGVCNVKCSTGGACRAVKARLIGFDWHKQKPLK
jgi:hypothetical protein